MLDWQMHLSGSVKGPPETIVQIKQCSFTGGALIRRAHGRLPPLLGSGLLCSLLVLWVTVQRTASSRCSRSFSSVKEIPCTFSTGSFLGFWSDVRRWSP